MQILKTAFVSTLLGVVVLPSAAAPAKVVVNITGKGPLQVLATEASDTKITYLKTPTDTKPKEIDRAEVGNVFFYRPVEFQKAIENYADNKFAAALVDFQKCKEQYSGLKTIKGNYSVLAGFYEIECARRTGDYAKMETLLESFRNKALTNENHITQLEIYPFWSAVKTESWDRVITLAKSWEKKKLPGAQRAQLAYCEGLALEAKGDRENALLKFSAALALSQLKEPDLVEMACEKCMQLILADPGVMEARKAIGKGDENKSSQAFYQLLEAASCAKLWDNMSFKTKPLPAEYKDLLKVSIAAKAK